jgi:uncharacterized protein YndB with AHSA1/START domain
MKWIQRIVLGILGLIVLAVVVLFALSKRPGAGETEVTVEIARPPAVVWAWLTEEPKLVQWVGWLTDVVPDPATPPGVGHKETWVMLDPNSKEPMRIVTTVTREDAPRAAAARLEVPGAFVGDVSYDLTDLGSGRTQLRQKSVFHMKNPVFTLMEPLVTPEARKKANADFARLKQLAEAATP